MTIVISQLNNKLKPNNIHYTKLDQVIDTLVKEKKLIYNPSISYVTYALGRC